MQRVKRFYPRRLRNQMIAMAIVMVSVPTLTIGYIVETEGQAAVLAEKEKKLSGITRRLNAELEERFSHHAFLPRAERIAALNRELSPITEKIAEAFPGIGAGYYHRELDAIITYAPAALYQSNVGITINPDHPGREVMTTRQALVSSGHQVRGHIMNSMIPIERQGEVIGYIWANELSEDIRQQAWKMDVRIAAVLVCGLLVSLLLIVVFSRRLGTNIDVITQGLEGLAQSLHTRLPPLPGEMGQISRSVNALAQALGETRTLNDLIVENAADGVIAIDSAGCVTAMNPAAQQITGYSRDELLGLPYAALFTDNGYTSPVLDTLERGIEHRALEVSFPAKERAIELIVTTSQLRNDRGELVGALVIFSDLTARKEAQRRLAQAERLATLGELMAGVAHEVRNPLTAIRGYVQILKQQDTQIHHQEYLAIILKEIDAINRVIQQLLDFSRPRQGPRQAVSLNQMIDESLVLIQTSGLQARIDFTCELAPDLAMILADRELLRQVILNILINAVQSISARGSISIRSWQYDDDRQAVQIADDGCGIPAELQHKIFEPFFTTRASGTGLGLALSQRIISAHQGDILLSSEPGRGTTFTIILPVRSQGNK
nr:two-component system sensor histidine kinase AtoS [Entomohabitans teleogrylli]